MPSPSQPAKRDLRIDFFRGLALIFIFIDHSPGNALSAVTLHSFGFSDAAEVFVLLAGYSAVLAYGGKLAADDPAPGVEKVGLRVWQIYLWHLACLAAAIIVLFAASHAFGTDRYTGGIGVERFATDPAVAILSAALLILQTNLFNILPRYNILMTAFPMIFLLLRHNLRLGLAVSAAIWLMSGWLNLPLAGGDKTWFFNPFAWQLVMAIGAAAAIAVRRGQLQRSQPLLLCLAVAYVVAALLYAAPWARITGLETLGPLPADLLGKIDKTNVSVWRVAHVIALGYIAYSVIAPRAAWLQGSLARSVSRLGRHSLEIFSLGILLSLLGWIAFEEAGTHWPVQVAVNVVGVGVMGFAGWWLSERQKAADRVRDRMHASSVAGRASSSRLSSPWRLRLLPASARRDLLIAARRPRS